MSIVVAALLAAIALGLAGGYAAKGLSTVSAPVKPAKVNVVQPGLFTAPDANDHSWMAPKAGPSHVIRKHQTVF